jgi:hypothetical protein
LEKKHLGKLPLGSERKRFGDNIKVQKSSLMKNVCEWYEVDCVGV